MARAPIRSDAARARRAALMSRSEPRRRPWLRSLPYPPAVEHVHSISVDPSDTEERWSLRLGIGLIGRKIECQCGENLNSLCIAACQQVDQIFLVRLPEYNSVQQPLSAQALKPRGVAALR